MKYVYFQTTCKMYKIYKINKLMQIKGTYYVLNNKQLIQVYLNIHIFQ